MKTKTIVRFIVILFISLVLFKGFLFFHFTHYKQFYIEKINHFLQNEINPGIKIGDIKYKILSLSLGTEFTLSNIILVDSMYQKSHQMPTILIGEANLRLKLLDILYRKITIKEINIHDAQFNLFTMKNGYSNDYLLKSKNKEIVNKPEKKIEQSKIVAKLETMSISNSRINIHQFDIGKQYEFYINKVHLDPDILDKNLKIKTKLDVICKHLTLSEKNGTFLKDAHIVANPMVMLSDNLIKIIPCNYTIDDMDIRFGALFGLQKGKDTLDLDIQSDDINFGKTITLLPKNLEMVMKAINFEKKLKAKARIIGHLSDSDPTIKVNFNITKNKTRLPFMDLNDINLSGYFINKFNPSLAISDDNSAIIVDSISGSNDNTYLSAKNIEIINMIKPILKASIVLKGNVIGLKKFIPKNEVLLTDGTYLIKGIYQNDIDINLQKLLDIKGEFEFHKIKGYVPKYNYRIQNFECKAKYKDKKIQVSKLTFDMNYQKDLAHQFTFNSLKAIFDFKKKFKIVTQFISKAQPEIFSQFTRQYHIEPTNGHVEFTGTFDDFLFFDIDNIPNINGQLKLNNLDIHLSEYPYDLLQTTGNIKISKSIASVEKLSTIIHSKKDKDNSNDLNLTTTNTMVELSSKPIIHTNFDIKTPAKFLNSIIDPKIILINRGDVHILGVFDGIIEGTFDNISRLKTQISFQNVDLDLVPYRLNLHHINGTILQNQWDLNMTNLSSMYKMYKINLAIKSSDLMKYFMGYSDTTYSTIDINIPALSINTIEDINKQMEGLHPSKKNDSFALRPYLIDEFSKYRAHSGLLSLKIDRLIYQHYLIKNLDIKLSKTRNLAILKRCNFNLGDGKVAISGQFDSTNSLYSFINIHNISLPFIKKKLSQLLPKKLQNSSLNGVFNFSSQMKLLLDHHDSIVPKSLYASSTIRLDSVETTHLNDLVGLKPKWLFNPKLKKVQVAPLNLLVDTKKDSSILGNTLIKTNLVDIWIEGNNVLHQNTKITATIPYYNVSKILFNTKKSIDSIQKVKHSFKKEFSF